MVGNSLIKSNTVIENAHMKIYCVYINQIIDILYFYFKALVSHWVSASATRDSSNYCVSLKYSESQFNNRKMQKDSPTTENSNLFNFKFLPFIDRLFNSEDPVELR